MNAKTEKWTTTAAVAIIVVCAVSVIAQQPQTTPEATLGAALHQAEVEGNLDKAIATYKQVVADKRASRATVATALLQLAVAYERLGKPTDARKTYAQIVNEYPDQLSVVAQARARLGNATGAPSVGMQQLWAGPQVEVSGSLSADGRYVSFVDHTTGQAIVSIHDFETGADRQLVNEAGLAVFNTAISRDGKRVAYSLNTGSHYELRIVGAAGTGAAQPRTVYSNPDVQFIAPGDWSPDGSLIAVQLRRVDRTTQLGVVTVSDGTLRVLKSIDWRRSSKLAISWDGQSLAFDLPVNEESEDRDVFTIALDGSRETSVVSAPGDDRVIGWSPGGHVLVNSNRNGSMGLWIVPLTAGKPGVPELVKPDLAMAYALGVSRSGSLYYGVVQGGRDIYVADFDPTGAKALSVATRLLQQYVGFNVQPNWSPDGAYIAYVVRRGLTGNGQLDTLGIRATSSGESRYITPKLRYFNNYDPKAVWEAGNGSLIVAGADSKGRNGIYRLNLQNGDASALLYATPGELARPLALTDDGKRLLYDRQTGTGHALIERDLTQGKDRELSRIAGSSLALSPDRQQVAYMKDGKLMLSPIMGGQAKELASVSHPGEFNGFAWIPDGTAILFSESELSLVPIDGGPLRKIDSRLRPDQMTVNPRQNTACVCLGHIQK